MRDAFTQARLDFRFTFREKPGSSWEEGPEQLQLYFTEAIMSPWN